MKTKNKIIWSREESKERFPEALSPLGWDLLQVPLQSTLDAMTRGLGLSTVQADRVVRRINGYVYTRKGFFKSPWRARPRWSHIVKVTFLFFCLLMKRAMKGPVPIFSFLGYGIFFVYKQRKAKNVSLIGLKLNDPIHGFFCEAMEKYFGQQAGVLVSAWDRTFSGLRERFSTNYLEGAPTPLTLEAFRDIRHRMSVDSRDYFAEDFKVFFLKNIYSAWLKANLKLAGVADSEQWLLSLTQGQRENFSTDMAWKFKQRCGDSTVSIAELKKQFGHLTENWDILHPLLGERESFWARLPFSEGDGAARIENEAKRNSLEMETKKLFEPKNKLASQSESQVASQITVQILRDFEIYQKLILIDEDLRASSSLQYPQVRLLFERVSQSPFWHKTGLKPEDIYFLNLLEIELILGGQAPPEVQKVTAERRLQWVQAGQNEPPEQIIESNESFIASENQAPKNVQILVSGVAKGPLLLVKSFDDLREFRKGVILVLKSPTPVFAPYYADAGAIVSETGGALSHGAIVAREFGIPMISGMTGLFEKFHSGEMVEVDTQSGTITKLNGGGYVSTNPELGKQSPITF